MVSTNPRVPENMQNKQHECILCCRNCTDAEGLVLPRTEFHRAVKKGHSPTVGLGRQGHKTSYLCLTCEFVPLCRKVRIYGLHSKSCWDLFHSEEDLFNGSASTMCDIANPVAELNVPEKFMSKRKPKKMSEAIMSAARSNKRSCPVVLHVTQRRQGTRRKGNPKTAAL